jgi:hypothetical protein
MPQGAVALSSTYADSSFIDTLIEMFLQQTLAEPIFSPYRRGHIIYPRAATKHFAGGYSTTKFDPGPILDAIKTVDPIERRLLNYEYCLSKNLSADVDTTDICSVENIEKLFGRQNFAAATLKFKLLLDFANNNPNDRDYDYERDQTGNPTILVHNDKNANLIKSAKERFNVKLNSLRDSLEDSTFFLRDDIVYVSFRFFDKFGETDMAMKSLCQITRLPITVADHVLLAKAILKDRAHDCNS